MQQIIQKKPFNPYTLVIIQPLTAVAVSIFLGLLPTSALNQIYALAETAGINTFLSYFSRVATIHAHILEHNPERWPYVSLFLLFMIMSLAAAMVSFPLMLGKYLHPSNEAAAAWDMKLRPTGIKLRFVEKLALLFSCILPVGLMLYGLMDYFHSPLALNFLESAYEGTMHEDGAAVMPYALNGHFILLGYAVTYTFLCSIWNGYMPRREDRDINKNAPG